MTIIMIARQMEEVENLCKILQPFLETTNLIPGLSYPTSNICFLQVWKIECTLKENVLNEDEVMQR